MRSRRGLPALLMVLVLSGCHGPTHHVVGVRSDARTVYSSIQRLTAASPVTAPTASPKTPRQMDATTTNTRDWNCIRRWESSGGVGNGNYTQRADEPQTGAYSFLNTTWTGSFLRQVGQAWQSSRALQDAMALKLYAWGLRYFGNGFEQWSTRFRCGLG